MWKWLVSVVVTLVVVCGGGGWLISSSGMFDQFGPQVKEVAEVRMAVSSRADLVRRVSAPGDLEPKAEVQISAQVVARIEKLYVDQGDEVTAGQLIVELEDEDLQANLDLARATLKSAQARQTQAEIGLETARSGYRSDEARLVGAGAALDQARAEVGRVRELFDTGDEPQATLDSAEAAHTQAASSVQSFEASLEIAEQGIRRAQAEGLNAQASVDTANATIRRANKNLANTKIHSPLTGRVTVLNAQEGELVVIGTLNSPGSVIIEIADLSQMLVQARVDESSVASVRAGQIAQVYINAYPDEPFAGVVQRIGLKRLTWRDGTNYFETEILLTLDEDRTLRSGLTATCEIEVETVAGALQVPSQAVVSRRIDELPESVLDAAPFVNRRKTFARIVYTLVDGKAVALPVRVGVSDLVNTAIIEGLDEDQPVVVGPYKVLADLRHDDELSEIDGDKAARTVSDTEAETTSAESPGA